MACNYASGLSKYDDKGICGVPEIFDSPEELDQKINILANMITEAKYVVVHTGAGISTSAGIPDFRGPNGVWTLENKGIKPEISISFNDAEPTFTHMALVALANEGKIQFLVSQNIDGLHLRSNFPPHKLAELHGNMFLDKCSFCERLFICKEAAKTVGQKYTGKICSLPKTNKRRCRGKLRDTILDWEDELPNRDLDLAEFHSKNSDLSICLGSTLQIIPSGKLPLLTKKNKGKLVICNLQPTKHDKQADLLIRGYVDDVMKKLTHLLQVEVPDYEVVCDPTKYVDCELKHYITEPPENMELTISNARKKIKKFKEENFSDCNSCKNSTQSQENEASSILIKKPKEENSSDSEAHKIDSFKEEL